MISKGISRNICMGYRSQSQLRFWMWLPRNEAPNNVVIQPIVFVSKSLTGAETWYKNIEMEVLGILHGLYFFHHYCFACMITDNKPLVEIFKKDVANLSHRLQGILLQVHQYNIRKAYKPGPQLFRHNHETNRDKKIPGCTLH